MPDESKSGTIWQDDELDAIVADYFVMLGDELAGKPYVKHQHCVALMAKIGRTHRSVEFKHQNISAVLDELGMPWIRGYKPMANYQNAIFDAIDRYLSNNSGILEAAEKPATIPDATSDIFVPPPDLKKDVEKTPERLRQLIGKFDPVKRDYQNRTLGKAGEEFVVDVERRRLTSADRSDLARKVRWTAAEDGDGAGYDIASFNFDGKPRLIEVNTTNGSARTPFFLTRNEFNIAQQRPIEWQIYRVHLFSSVPRVFTISPPLENHIKLTTETWRATF